MTGGDGNGSEHWLVKSLGGVNLLGLISLLVAGVWVVAGNYFGPDKRLTVIEQHLSAINSKFDDSRKRFDDVESQIDALRSTDTEIAVMKLTGENTAAIVHRLEAGLDSVKEGQRDLQSKLRDLERRYSIE